MPVKRFYMDADQFGSMVDSIDSLLHRDGPKRPLKECRNYIRTRGRMDRRPGWLKANATAMPWNAAIGATAYRDSERTLHVVVVGDDNNIYHSLDKGATFTACVQYDEVTWDGTYQASFAACGDDLFITLGAVTGAGQNLRFNGISCAVFGVSLPAAVAAPTVADGGAGNIADGALDYFVTILDATTGWESDASPVASIVLARPATPITLTAADGGAGAMGANTYRYRYTIYQPATGIQSEPSNVRSIQQAAAHQVALSDIQVCSEAGVWHRRIYRDDNGTGYRLLTTIADNTTTTYADNNVAALGAEYEYAGRQVALAAIPTSPALGRTIHRKIYRQDDGAGYNHLDTITDNTTLVYTDNLAAAPGDPYVQQTAVPVCKHVAFLPDNIALYGHDVENGEPARIYVAKSGYPEAINLDNMFRAGTDDDPITGMKSVRDGVVVGKRRSLYYVDRQCKNCERMIEKCGVVSGATMQNVGSLFAFLSAEGPRFTTHFSDEDVRFVGQFPNRFCLAETWDKVVAERLPFASSVHYPRESLILWFVQMCKQSGSYATSYGQHNDTAIVWDYGSRTYDNPGGDVWLADIMVDHGFLLPVPGSEFDEAWGAFPLGYVGNMFHGQHGDGVDEMIEVAVVSASGQYITIGETNLLTGEALSLDAEGWRGSIFHVKGGAASRRCRAVLPCDRPNALIVDHSVASGIAGRRLKTAVALGVDGTSVAWIGGFGPRLWLQLDTGDPDPIKVFPQADIHFKGA